MSGREIRRLWRVRVLLAAVPVAMFSLLAPGSASAQTAGDACEGELTGEGRRAELSFSCNFSVIGIEVFSNKDATIRGDFKGEEGQGREGFRCFQPILKGPSGQQGGDSFGEAPALCEGGLSAGNTATGTLIARDDVCDPLALRVTASGRGEDTFIVRIQRCGRDDPDEDEGQTPRGGVQSGGGGAAPADAPGAGLLAAAGVLLAAALGFRIVRVRGGGGRPREEPGRKGGDA